MFRIPPFSSRVNVSYCNHRNQSDNSWLNGSSFSLVRAALLVIPFLFAFATPASAQSAIILHGRAVYSTGEPAVNATVRLTKTVYDVSPNIVTYETTITDSGGDYSFQIEARCAVVYETQATVAAVVDDEVLAPSSPISASGCVLGDITFNDLTINKPHQITLGGIVRDQFSIPVQGITVIMTRTKYDVNPNIVTTASTTTDQNGHYQFRVFSRCAIVEAMSVGSGASSTSGCVLSDYDSLDLGVFLPSCGSATVARPANQTINSPTGWSMRAEVSDTDGLVLRDVKLRHRYMAKEISVPYYVLDTSAFTQVRGELTPDSSSFYSRSRLVDYSVVENADMLVIQATYAIDRIPSTSQSCLTITQRYEFYPPIGSCEPSETLDCARFKPIMQYRFAGSGGEYLRSLNIVQRDHFQVNGIDGNASGVFQDCNIAPWLSGCLSSGGGIGFANKINPMFSEFSGNAVNHGLNGDWDNYHQTFNRSISEPLPPLRPAGCPECVHMHWRWGTWLVEDLDPKFGRGLPMIPSGSLQDVDIALVRHHDGEEDPTDYHTLVNGEAVQTNIPIFHDPLGVVFWYSATGRQAQDTFFTHGIFFNPSTPNVQASAGDVSVIYSDLYEDGALSATPIDPASAGTLPQGYVPYNNLAYEVATEATVSGPHTVTFHVPTVTDPALLASMKVFHGEEGVLVDRTFGSDFAARTISAKVNSFSPFVIAVPVPTGSQLTSLGPAQMWVGLKNSDDVGTKFDLLAEVFKNGTLIGSGQLNDVAGGSSGFNNAKLDVINLALPASVAFQTGDALKIKLSVRIAASSGHRSGTARVWFNDSAANSRFTATVDGVLRTYFLRSSFGLATSAGSGPKTTVDVTVDRAVGGNPFKTFGTWTVAL